MLKTGNVELFRLFFLGGEKTEHPIIIKMKSLVDGEEMTGY